MKTAENRDIRSILNDELANVYTSGLQRQILYEKATGGKVMKKKIPLGLVLAIVLSLTVCTALAATGAFDAIKAMWEDSFNRMNTTAQVDIVDEPDIPAYMEQFEAEYGGEKEDLVLSTVPGEDDLSLDEAVWIAKDAVMKKFGTPQEELDAMGIYPAFYMTPWQDSIPQWRVYISSRTDVNLDENHDYPAPGEYLVEIDSSSGEVSACFFYNDDFWPEYALRCWENGSRDYVYEQAQYPAFMKQSTENRRYFINIFAEAGYDTAPLEKAQSDEARLRAMSIDICFAGINDDLLDSSDPFVQTAIREMESRYGITKADMVRCRFAAIRSPQPSKTVDICFSYNFNKEAAADTGLCETLGTGYGTRLGYFMICMDAQSGEAVSAVNIIWDEYLLPEYNGGLLSRMFWTKDDLPEYYRMMEELRALDAAYVAGRDPENTLLNEADKVMLRYGGDPALYTAQRPDTGGYTFAQFLYDHHLTEEEIIEKGRAYLVSHTVYTETDLKRACFCPGTAYNDPEDPDPGRLHPTLLVLLETKNDEGMRWYFQFDLDLNIVQFDESEGNIHG
ncbi:MAG: hypothetical protein CW338_10140 [Clostridiales bacterium]|nr:hypothetical protein [Clostridiales bacterium]